MDRRIDLTVNSDFRKRNRILPKRFTDQALFRVRTDDLLFLGNQEDIRYQKEVSRAVSGLFCDRCGEPLYVFPWEDLQGLCRTCEQELREEVRGRFPWGKNVERNQASRDPVIMEANAIKRKS